MESSGQVRLVDECKQMACRTATQSSGSLHSANPFPPSSTNAMSFRNSQPESLSALNRFFSNVILLLSIWLIAVIMSSCGTPTIDLPATELDVVVQVLDTHPDPFDGKVAVRMQFFHEGQRVSPSDTTARITCNGVRMQENGEGHTARVPLVPQGGSYRFRHEHMGLIAETSLSTQLPTRMVSTVSDGGPAAISTREDLHSGGGFHSIHSEYATHRPLAPQPKKSEYYSRTLAQQAENTRFFSRK